MTKRALQLKAIKALREAVREVVEEHRRSGRRLVVWRNGKIMKIPASQAFRKKQVKKLLTNNELYVKKRTIRLYHWR